MNKQQALKLALSSGVIARLPETTEGIEIDFVRVGKHEEYYAEELMPTWQVLGADKNVEVYIKSDFITIFIKALSLTWDDFENVTISTDKDEFMFSEVLADYPSDYKNLAKHRNRRKHVTVPKSNFKPGE